MLVINKAAIERQEKIDNLRQQRNLLLLQSDALVTIDRWESYSDERKEAVRKYRKGLRDLFNDDFDPNNFDWPKII